MNRVILFAAISLSLFCSTGFAKLNASESRKFGEEYRLFARAHGELRRNSEALKFFLKSNLVLLGSFKANAAFPELNF
jgi:hypothetical protein